MNYWLIAIKGTDSRETKIEYKKISFFYSCHSHFFSQILRVCLNTVYFAKIEKLLLKVL